MKGIWKGYYQHQSKMITEDLRNRLTKFEIEIQEANKSNFTGTVMDDVESGGMKGTGIISGTIEKNKINFIKRMPTETIIMPDGNIKTNERKHPPIYYSGVLNNERNKIEGTWKFKLGITFIGFIPAIRLPIKGIWEMKKE